MASVRLSTLSLTSHAATLPYLVCCMVCLQLVFINGLHGGQVGSGKRALQSTCSHASRASVVQVILGENHTHNCFSALRKQSRNNSNHLIAFQCKLATRQQLHAVTTCPANEKQLCVRLAYEDSIHTWSMPSGRLGMVCKLSGLDEIMRAGFLNVMAPSSSGANGMKDWLSGRLPPDITPGFIMTKSSPPNR